MLLAGSLPGSGMPAQAMQTGTANRHIRAHVFSPSQSCVTPLGVTPSGSFQPEDCIASLSPAKQYGAIGIPQSVTFLCGNGAAALTGGGFTGVPGCYDVIFTLTDIATGDAGSFSSAYCAGVAMPITASINCSSVANPICPAGYQPGPGGPPTQQCSPCPSGFVIAGTQCQGPPVLNTCPSGYTAHTNPGGGVIFCTGPFFPTTPTDDNKAIVTFTPSSPDAFVVQATGYVGTQTDGRCPTGTTLAGNVIPAPNGPIPGCRFTLFAASDALVVTSIQVIPPGTCSGQTGIDPYHQLVSQGCLVQIAVFGEVTIKRPVDCSQEPASGTDATSGGFPPGSVYICDQGRLAVTNVPVPNVPLSDFVTGGILQPTCFPVYPPPTGGTGGTPTATTSAVPIATPRGPTDTPVPTATSVNTVPPGSSAFGPAFCSPPGATLGQQTTGSGGTVGVVGGEVEYSAEVQPSNPAQNDAIHIVGHISLDGVPQGGVVMFAHYEDSNGRTFTCGPIQTDAGGTGTCSTVIDGAPIGVPVNVQVDFLFNCNDYTTTATFVPGASDADAPTPTPPARAPAPNGVCVSRTGPGAPLLEVTYKSPIDSQPSITSGQIPIGQFSAPTLTPSLPTLEPTNTPIPTNTPGPPTETPTTTPTPVPVTETPTLTSTAPPPPPTSTETPTPSPRPTSTPTRVPRLRFSLTAARVAGPNDQGDRKGLDSVHPGQAVRLMMYYTVRSMPRSLTRVTTYQIRQGGHIVFTAEYRGTQNASDLGTFVRYIPYTLASTLPFGVYTFTATLKIGTVIRHRDWKFAVVRNGRLAPRSHTSLFAF